jgi:mono/diheme cytochrome c family protein
MTMNRFVLALCLATNLGTVAPACAQSPALPTSRGALLYETHCIACHSTQMHWRENKSATDWPGLKTQVQRWQASIGLGWNENDIDEVARHLNARYYRFDLAGARVVSALTR